MNDPTHPLTERAEALESLTKARSGIRTTELWITLAQLAFAGWALWLGKDDVAMVALAAAGLYPVSRAWTKA